VLTEWNLSDDKQKLSKDDIIRIGHAGVHPERR